MKCPVYYDHVRGRYLSPLPPISLLLLFYSFLSPRDLRKSYATAPMRSAASPTTHCLQQRHARVRIRREYSLISTLHVFCSGNIIYWFLPNNKIMSRIWLSPRVLVLKTARVNVGCSCPFLLTRPPVTSNIPTYTRRAPSASRVSDLSVGGLTKARQFLPFLQREPRHRVQV
jgi:hypothetical protein